MDECCEDGNITVAELLKILGNRALALAILVFSISAVIAGIVPGFSTIMAMPIMFMAIQIVFGQRRLYLPDTIRSKEISPKIISGALAQSVPTLRKVEKYLRPRLLLFTSNMFQRVIAIVILALAGILALPIPGGNFLPSFTISLLALAMIERDGLLVLFTILTLFFTGTLMIELIAQAWILLQSLV